MKKRYIAIYNGKEGSKSIFFDTETKKLVVVKIENISYKLTILSGFIGVSMYYLFGKVLIESALPPIALVAMILIVGCLAGMFFNILVNKIANSEKNKLEYLTNITEDELKEYIIEGRKQMWKNLLLIVFLLFMTIVSLLPIYFGEYSLLLLLASIFFTILVTFFIGVVAPNKRIVVFRYIKKNKELVILTDNR
ncbi:hypothetical protein [Enterococcus wangshanyuanii]